MLDDLQARLEVSNQNLRGRGRLPPGAGLADAARARVVPGHQRHRRATRSASSAATATSGNAPARNSFSLGATVSWELDVWGRIARTSRAPTPASPPAPPTSPRPPVGPGHAGQTCFQLRAAERQQALLDASVAAYARALELTRNRYAAGVASSADVAQARASCAAAGRGLDASAVAQPVRARHRGAARPGSPAAFTWRRPMPRCRWRRWPSRCRPRCSSVAPTSPPPNAGCRRQRRHRLPGGALPGAGPVRATAASATPRSDLLTVPSRYWSLGPTLAAAIFDAGAKKPPSARPRPMGGPSPPTARPCWWPSREVEDNLASARLLEPRPSGRPPPSPPPPRPRPSPSTSTAGTVSYLNVVTAQATLLAARRSANDLAARRLLATSCQERQGQGEE